MACKIVFEVEGGEEGGGEGSWEYGISRGIEEIAITFSRS